MQLIKNILLATDFTGSRKNLVDTAISLGQNFHSDISIIHVIPKEIKDKKSKSMLEDAARESMDALIEQIKDANVKIGKTYIRQGNPVDTIVRTAERVNSNVILMGSSETPKKDNYKLGTTAEKIIRKSQVPVWVAKRDSQFEIKTVFCPIDFSDESKRALQDAEYIARIFKARLIIFSVFELYDKNYPRLDSTSGGMNKLAQTEHEKMLEKFLKSTKTTDLDVKVVTRSGDPSKEILKALKRFQADLLIMGTTGKSGLSRWLMGSVTEKVIREVPCSFITVKSTNILTVELQERVKDMEYHYKAAQELLEKGLFEESVSEFLVCLNMNDMHIPSLVGISKAYEKLGDERLAENYKKIARKTLTNMWDEKIEAEVRKHYSL